MRGGHHLDHITAYSEDDTPVLELCRSDPKQVVDGFMGLKAPLLGGWEHSRLTVNLSQSVMSINTSTERNPNCKSVSPKR